MDQDNADAKPRLSLAPKPRLVETARPTPRRASAHIAKFPEAGSFEHLWRVAMLQYPKTIMGSWLLGAGKIAAAATAGWMLWDASCGMGARFAPILDGLAQSGLSVDAGLSALATARLSPHARFSACL